MANFRGFLLKCADGNNDIFPHQYIDFGTWSSTPDQREEIKAYRDDNTRNLVRVTAAGRKTVISFKTRANLNKAQKEEIMTFFTSNETNATERKIHLTFWNDETASYDTGYFYRPNMPFPIKYITETDIIYDAMQFDLIEY